MATSDHEAGERCGEGIQVEASMGPLSPVAVEGKEPDEEGGL